MQHPSLSLPATSLQRHRYSGVVTERRWCANCGVWIEAGQARCPLCRSHGTARRTQETSAQSAETQVSAVTRVANSYPDYAHTRHDARTVTPLRLLIFSSICVGAITLTVNLLTWQARGYLWSAFPILGLAAAWSFFAILHSRHLNLAARLLLLFISVSSIVVAVDAWSGFHRWSTTFVVPFLSIALVAVMTILAAAPRNSYSEYMGYLLATFIIAAATLLLSAFSLSTQLWPSVAALVYSLLTVVGLWMFSGQRFGAEMRRRFHL